MRLPLLIIGLVALGGHLYPSTARAGVVSAAVHPAWDVARGRIVYGRGLSTPWEGHWFGVKTRQGVRIPLSGEVAWILPAGPKPYRRGCIQRITFDFTS
ncbi:MAG: hypothetical protein JXQ27_19090 [Acidobacteria bacterium]|nr:hypothetical protein [Acidobacteriota bacterium]